MTGRMSKLVRPGTHRLSLHRTTLRQLTATQLAAVHGGEAGGTSNDPRENHKSEAILATCIDCPDVPVETISVANPALLA
jgi:hypothetical protein